MGDTSVKWNELRAKFLRDFTASEQVFFLTQARECVNRKGYPVSEDLFTYCSFLTLRERIRLIDPRGGGGLMRFMLVESSREIEAEARAVEKRLEARMQPHVDASGARLLEELSR